jgi:hypothetical protein
MHPEIASALAEQHRRDLARQAGWLPGLRQQVSSAPTGKRRQRHAAQSTRGPRRHAPSWRVPRYYVSWSRTTLTPAGATGRRERSWVIVISATRGL